MVYTQGKGQKVINGTHEAANTIKIGAEDGLEYV